MNKARITIDSTGYHQNSWPLRWGTSDSLPTIHHFVAASWVFMANLRYIYRKKTT